MKDESCDREKGRLREQFEALIDETRWLLPCEQEAAKNQKKGFFFGRYRCDECSNTEPWIDGKAIRCQLVRQQQKGVRVKTLQEKAAEAVHELVSNALGSLQRVAVGNHDADEEKIHASIEALKHAVSWLDSMRGERE